LASLAFLGEARIELLRGLAEHEVALGRGGEGLAVVCS